MKKLSLIMAVLMIALMIAVPASAASGKGSFGEVPLYKGGITVDGVIDEAYTELGLKIDATQSFDSGRYKSDAKAWLYMLHDGENLYLVYDVSDPYDLDVSKYPKANEDGGAWKNAGTELYVDWGCTGAVSTMAKVCAWIDGRHWGAGGTLTAGENVKNYVAEYKTVVDKANKKYVLEFKLPFNDGAKIGSEVGFNAMITSNDDIATGNQDHITCTLPGVSNAAAEFKNETLSSTEVKMPEAPKEEPKEEQKPTENPTTGDPITVLAIIAAVSGAGVVISKKR